MDWTGVVGVILAGAATVTLLALLDYKYLRIPLRRAVWREILWVVLIGVIGYIIGSFYPG